MLTRQYRNTPPKQKAITKSVSMTEEMAERIVAEAAREGHNNFSTVVNVALVEHFDKQDSAQEVA